MAVSPGSVGCPQDMSSVFGPDSAERTLIGGPGARGWGLEVVAVGRCPLIVTVPTASGRPRGCRIPDGHNGTRRSSFPRRHDEPAVPSFSSHGLSPRFVLCGAATGAAN